MKTEIVLLKRRVGLILILLVCCWSASAQLICVPPLITVQPVSSTVCVGNISLFTVVSLGTNLSYQWQVNNGSGFVNCVNGGAYSGALTAVLQVTGSVSLNGGQYRCIVSNSCGTRTTNLCLLNIPSLTGGATPAIICQGASATLSVTGAVNYLWNTGATSASIVVTPASTTTYSCTGTTLTGCTVTKSITVTVNPSPNVTASASPSAVCPGASSILTASGANTYQWSTGQTGSSISVTPSATTTYSVTGTNSLGCSKTVSVTVTVNPLPNVTATASPSSICPGASSTLTAGGATSYQWNTGATTASIVVTPGATTTYTVTGTNSFGCSKSKTVTVTVNPLPAVTATASPSAICSGSSSTLTAGGATSYQWNTGATTASIVVTPGATTTYTVTGTNSFGCSKSKSVTVTVHPSPAISITASDPTICSGETTFLTANGASSYMWSTGQSGPQISVSPTQTTTYSVTGTSSNGCSASKSYTITIGPIVTVTATDPELCPGGFTFLTASGASTYLWSTGETGAQIGASPTQTTTYQVTGTGANGCSSSAQITVTVVGSSVSVVATDPEVCPGGFTFLVASGAAEYLWSTGETGSQIGVSPTVTTTYEVTGSNGGGCTSTASVTVTVGPIVTVSASDPNLCPGGFTFLNASGAATYLWSTGETGPQIGTTLFETSSYTVTGTSADGSCSATAEITVFVDPNCTSPSGRKSGQRVVTSDDALLEFSSEELSLYPNPTKGIVYINGGLEDATVEIFNVMGQRVYANTIGQNKEIDLTSYANGVYFVRLRHKGAPIYGARVHKE